MEEFEGTQRHLQEMSETHLGQNEGQEQEAQEESWDWTPELPSGWALSSSSDLGPRPLPVRIREPECTAEEAGHPPVHVPGAPALLCPRGQAAGQDGFFLEEIRGAALLSCPAPTASS